MTAPTQQPQTPVVLAVYDFDGTLTYRDSFTAFLYYAFGPLGFLWRLRHLCRPSLAYLLRRRARNQLKADLIRTFLTGVDQQWLEARAQAFCTAKWSSLIRPEGLLSVLQQKHEGAIVTLCSASPVLILRPFAARLNVCLLGTELEVVEHRLTGNILGENCRAEQKVQRLVAQYGQLDQFHVRAWGDSAGDRPLLAHANEPYWRHFHRRRSWLGRLKALLRLRRPF